MITSLTMRPSSSRVLSSVYADGQVRATVSYGAYGDLEALDAALAASGLSMTDESTLEEDGRMVSDVIIGAAA